MKRYIYCLLLCVLTAILLFSCRRTAYQIVYPSLNDGRYDSEFPYRNSSEELDDISKSVKKLYCLVEYDRYNFDANQHITRSGIKDINPRRTAISRGFFSESVHGSAIVIKNDNNKIVVLTCAHVLDYPDSLFSWFFDEDNNQTTILESFSIKKKQNNFIRELPGSGELDIIISDSDLDVAFLGNTFKEVNTYKNPVFQYPVGAARELEWGSFVYIMGFPAGYQMVTRGIVSNPKPGKKGEFIIDALFNQGISGGIVLAVRDGVPNFELVGIARSVSATYKNVLKPQNESHQEMYNPNVPYEGEVFVKVEKEQNYGITFTISIETISTLYYNNRNIFTARGYNLDGFFGKDE